MDRQDRSEAVSAKRPEDVESQFIHAGVLIPNACDGDGHTGGIDHSEGDAGGCDAAALFGFAEGVVELTPRPQLFLLGEGKLAKGEPRGQFPDGQVFREDCPARCAVGLRAFMAELASISGEVFEERREKKALIRVELLLARPIAEARVTDGEDRAGTAGSGEGKVRLARRCSVRGPCRHRGPC